MQGMQGMIWNKIPDFLPRQMFGTHPVFYRDPFLTHHYGGQLYYIDRKYID
jgi:hypothetical protein